MIWVFFRDKLREPKSVVLFTMLFGALATIPIVIIEFPLSLLFGVGIDSQIQTLWQAVGVSFVVAAFVEESFKFGVLRLYSARHSAFTEPFDGIVYGIAASLGFALVENIMYVFGSMYEGGFAGGFFVAIIRAIFAVPMHAACGVIMGACIGLSRFGGGVKWTFSGIVLAIVIHGTYDTFLFSMEVPEIAEDSFWIAVLFLGVICTTLLSVGVSLLIISRFRSDGKSIEIRRHVTVQEVAIATPELVSVKVQTVESIQKVQRGLPKLPIISLVVSMIAVALPIATMLIAILSVGFAGNANEFMDIVIGICILATFLLCVALFLLSVITICVEPRWRAASILSLLVAVLVFLLEIAILISGANY
jgi:protease PrsW